ncbi:MAG TPA: PP2C family serine/threonine-protein phosphatase [Pyrinomonadaceae bacterium]|nr:PP2C family serine/threonine-protein phosphatase [Pyrinomonadaceae bacterium]
MTDKTETAPAVQPADAARETAQAAEAHAEATEASQPAPSNEGARAAEDASVPSVAAPAAPAPLSDALIAARGAAEWRVIGETVPGASHLRAGIPNQDAIFHTRQSSARLPVIVSISDGHGSNKCFRSDRGSRFAVRIGANLLDELINGRHAALPPVEIESRVRESLPAQFIKRWRAAVDADLQREPFREEEFKRMVEKDGEKARRLVEANPYLAYGATSLSFLLTPTYALYLQLGDGEMINVSAGGEIVQPLPEDARLLANETTSLCLDKAADDFRFAIRPHDAGDLPALIILTTDGYYNSFSTTAGFHQVGGDLLQMLREEDGFDTVNRGVKGWLEEATAAGSGDDCTLAIICRMDALTASPSSGDPASNTDGASDASPVAPTQTSPAAPSQGASSQSSPSSSDAPPHNPDAPDASAASTPVASHEQSATPKTA